MTEHLLHGVRGIEMGSKWAAFGGRVLADLGAQVIKVEPVGVLSAPADGRQETVANRKVLDAGKKSVTLDVQAPEGKALLAKLAGVSDFVIYGVSPDDAEAGPVGILRQNDTIFVYASPYGRTGPKSAWKACDLTLMADGGQAYQAGYPDRPPVRCGVPQAALHAGIHAAIGTLIALRARREGGAGRVLDVSTQAAIGLLAVNPIVWWYAESWKWRRKGMYKARGNLVMRRDFPCKDGRIIFSLFGNRYGALVKGLVDWIVAEGSSDEDYLLSFNWNNLDLGAISQEDVERVESIFARFFLGHTKARLLEEASKRGIGLGPVSTVSDVMSMPLLERRGFWRTLDTSTGSRERYPGAPAKCHGVDWGPQGGPPTIGQNNREVFCDLLGCTLSQLKALEAKGVV